MAKKIKVIRVDALAGRYCVGDTAFVSLRAALSAASIRVDDDAQWVTTCLECGAEDQMRVVGFLAEVDTPLDACDGFDWTDGNVHDSSNEVVQCSACKKMVPMADIKLED